MMKVKLASSTILLIFSRSCDDNASLDLPAAANLACLASSSNMASLSSSSTLLAIYKQFINVEMSASAAAVITMVTPCKELKMKYLRV